MLVEFHREMAVSVGNLFKAITDFEGYPEFVSQVKRATVSVPGDCPQVEFELELIRHFHYRLEFELKADELVKWKLLESDFFKSNQGAWKLERSGSQKTVAHYSVDLEFGFLIPKWVSQQLIKIQLPKMLDEFENRAHVIQNKPATSIQGTKTNDAAKSSRKK